MSGAQNYRLLARYYDQFFTFHQYGYHLARKELLGGILPEVSSACDLACGTGTTAVELALMGIQVFALDFSSTMCRLTREKAAKAGVALRVIRGDMRSFKLPEQVDLITCEFDALNHVPRRTDLDRVAAAAARALRPGGVFCFDVNNRMAFEKLWPGTWRSERPGVVLIMWGGYDRARDCGWTEVEWFVRSGAQWRRFRERVEQVCWNSHEIRQSLRAAGFHCIRTKDATPFFQGEWKARPGCRTFYLAEKL